MTASGFTIEELAIPATLDAPGGDDFRGSVDVRNAVEAHSFGTAEFAMTAEELLPMWLKAEHEPKRLLIARAEGRVVARGMHEWRPSAGPETAWLSVEVDPAFRGRGIGSELVERLERIARDGGASKILGWAASPPQDGPRLEPPTGFGSVPAESSTVRFLLARGYRLEQVERASRLPLPVPEDLLAELLAQAEAAAGADYRIHCWTDATPVEWREDIALLETRMSTDAPSAGMEEPEDVWTVERLLAEEEASAASPRTSLVAAVEHVPSGRLGGFTELDVPAELDRVVGQEDTIVLREHRGHRLGMLLKLANIAHLTRERPGHPAVVTFNAEENRHMLSVNEAVGFVPIAYEGAYRKDL